MNQDELNRLSKLCRISFNEEEQKKFIDSVGQILSYMEELSQIDTQGIPCCNTVLSTLSNVLREDKPGALLSRDDFLANAPSHVGGMVKVPPVLKQDQ